MNKYLTLVKKMMDDISVYCPQKDEALCDNGGIFYMNGNDSTRFDWKCNDCLCEFMKFYKSTEYGYIKVRCNRNGSMDAYVYAEGGQYSFKPLAKKTVYNVLTENGMRNFYYMMLRVADDKNLWDKNIRELSW